jgi:putative mRNA 3-end processing factor
VKSWKATAKPGTPANSPVPLLEPREHGLYCPQGDFYIDPRLPVERAIVTHAHSDHAVPGSCSYLAAAPGEALLRARLGSDVVLQTAAYGERLTIGEAAVSLHPAGHILGSAQVRIEHRGEVWVVSGDYKSAPDPTCAPIEPRRCHTFVTESTFALPIFRWPSEIETMDAIDRWWRANRDAGRTSVLLVCPLGKAQRVLAGIDASIGPIECDPAVERFNAIYRGQGIALPASEKPGSLIVAPPNARRIPNSSTAMASGWMRIRGPRRRRSVDRGFVLSDHADWPALLRVIEDTGAESVWATHGYTGPLVRWLQERGRDARAIDVQFAEAEE